MSEVAPAKHRRKSRRALQEEAAAEVGVSRTTLEKGKRVVKKIDQLTDEGRGDEAQSLRETLNNKSVEAAIREVQAIDTGETGADIANPETRAIHRQVLKMKAAIDACKTAQQECMKACDAKNRTGKGFGIRFGKIVTMLRVLHDATQAPLYKINEIVAEWKKACEEMDE